jgi:hypothetical protein
MEKTQLKNILTKIGEVNPEYTLDKQVYNVGELIGFIDNPSEELRLVVVKKRPSSIKYIQNPTEEVGLAVVEKDPYSIKYIQNPTERVQLTAVEKDPRSIQFIKKPTQRVIQLLRPKGFNI